VRDQISVIPKKPMFPQKREPLRYRGKPSPLRERARVRVSSKLAALATTVAITPTQNPDSE
jgi:hypothetical protein